MRGVVSLVVESEQVNKNGSVDEKAQMSRYKLLLCVA